MNTGFGGSADTRVRGVDTVQNTIIKELHVGVLADPATSNDLQRVMNSKVLGRWSELQSLSLEDPNTSTCMPESWVRAAIVIRSNSLASGHSGVRPVLIQRMLDLLKRNIVPRIPLRGSISASGDLIPLSYIGGAISGEHGVAVWAGSRSHRYITSADVALTEASLIPITLGPKEGLAIINGTAVTAGVAALATHDTNCLAVLSQILTAMSVEALLGTRESFDPFFAEVRPHPGQKEAAQNIYSFLAGSRLAKDSNGLDETENSLFQDRYPIRTASQWIGPVLEDLLLAYQQVSIECNSATDNPLIQREGKSRVLHGGNFQAKAITSAMEKMRQGIQSIGQMLFAQCTELINSNLNKGLPPNLVADEPSESWLMKPLDIMIAALQSELGYLSNPAGSHVQSAEMANQALNSLGLISARYTHTAIDVLSQLAAAHLFAVCQALDLRAMHNRFLEAFRPILRRATLELLHLRHKEDLDHLLTLLWENFNRHLEQTSTMDSDVRFPSIFKLLQAVVLDFVSSTSDTVSSLRGWTERCSELALETYLANRTSYSLQPDATPILGVASCRMYKFVRTELSIPFIGAKHPDPPPLGKAANGEWSHSDGSSNSTSDRTAGGFISTIYNSIRDGSLYKPVMECLDQVGWSE